MSGLTNKITRLRKLLEQLDSVVVCFSGGVDSSYLLAESIRVRGDRTVALTAVSPSLAPEEGSSARNLAQQLGARHVLVDTFELDDPRYAENPINRCYFCKMEVYGQAVEKARGLGAAHVVDGFNVDDRSDYRPGKQAAREHGVRSPLDEAGFTKTDIREAARRLALPVWDKPALACLSSRFPYGTPVTPQRLTQVADCERVLRALGFQVCRVRHHVTMARIEVAPAEISRLRQPEILSEVTRRFKDAGFEDVDVDPRGYQAGGLNSPLETFPRPERPAPGPD
jgi:uncharacterized protein